MTSGQNAIDIALAHDDPRDVVEAVKMAVATELQGLSARFEVRRTEYFNHGYVPDLVAWWGPRDEDCREVFLRFDAAAESLAEDVQRLEDERPMFFSLQPRSRGEITGGVKAALELSPHVLITTSPAIEELVGAPGESFEELVTTAIVQGGRGVVDQALATAVRRTGAEGVSAAATTDLAKTSEAVSTLREVLWDEPALRVEKYLQTLWVAGGGVLDDFPGHQGLVLALSSEDIVSMLRFLFKQPAVSDVAFWQRLGERVDLDVLSELRSIEPTANLQSLLNSNLERFQVSFAAADTHEPRMALSAEPFNWLIANGLLHLDGPEFLLQFTADGRAFRGRKPDQALLAVEAVRRRAGGFRVEGLGLDDENLVITVEAKGHDDSSASTLFDDLASAIGSSPGVRSLHIRYGGHSMICHFDRRIVDVEDGRASLSDVGLVAATVLTPIDHAVRNQLAVFLGTDRSVGTLDFS